MAATLGGCSQSSTSSAEETCKLSSPGKLDVLQDVHKTGEGMYGRWERDHAAGLIPDPFFECCAKKNCLQLLLMDHRPFVQEIYAPLRKLSVQLQSHWKRQRNVGA